VAPSFSFGYSELLLANRLVESGRNELWTFEIVATAPDERRSFLIATGFEQVLDLLSGLALAENELAPLRVESGPARVEPVLDGSALARIAALRFHGDVLAVPEGTVVFPGEPLLRLRAPAPEAVIVGAAVVAMLRAQTTIATRTSKLRLAAGGKPVWELGPDAIAREAALLVSRAAFIGGIAATSNPLAATAWGLPARVIVPLSQLSAMGDAGRAFASCAVLLDGVGADQVEAAISGAPVKPRTLLLDVARMSDAPQRVAELRRSLDVQGWSEVGLVGTGELDEARLEELAPASVPLVGFAVTSELLQRPGADAPVFDCELVEREVSGKRVGIPRRDGGLGTRMAWRKRESGRFRADTVQPETKPPPPGSAPLIVPMMEKGKRLFRAPNLSEARVLVDAQLSMFDPAVIRRVDPQPYVVNCVVERPPAPPPPAPKPAAPPAPARKNVLDQLDDSADFTFVSNVFASVASKLTPDSADSSEVVEPMPDGAAEGASEPADAEAPLADAAQSTSLEEEAPDFEEVVDPPAPAPPPTAPKFAAPKFELPKPAPKVELPKLAPKVELPKVELPKPAPKVEAPPKPTRKAEPELAPVVETVGSESGGNNLLLVAAARLRSLQSGGVSMPKPSASSAPPTLPIPDYGAPVEPLPESSSAPAEPATPIAPVAPSSPVGGDPLLAAAARLRSMRGS
jgi:nicotinate phosphoribosyltransferase